MVRSPVDRAHYTVSEVAAGVHALLATSDGFAVCNSGAVDLGGSTAVFDTGLTAESARSLRALSTDLLGGTPSMVINSHRHIDHTFGNSEFTGVPIWATRRTRELFVESLDELRRELTRDKLEQELAGLESRRPRMTTDGARTDLEFNLSIVRALLSSIDTVTMVPPDRTFDAKLRLPGRRAAELLSFGAGHTPADTVLFLAEERVLFAGDLVALGVQPSMGDGDPAHWLTVLDEIERLRVEKLVPGHGPVTSTAGLAETREYLAGVLRASEAPVTASLPHAIRRWEGSVSLEQNLEFARGWAKRQAGAR